MRLFTEFKKFALKGNVLELSVAVIIGGAFGAIVSSLVHDVLTPLLLSPALQAAKVQDLEKLTWGTVKYGSFLSAVMNFLIIALILFLVVRAFKRFESKTDTQAPAPSSTDRLLIEIRDALRK
ncbi:MAG: large conductance mechanosensitive channel protein MscL [Microcystis sp.]